MIEEYKAKISSINNCRKTIDIILIKRKNIYISKSGIIYDCKSLLSEDGLLIIRKITKIKQKEIK